MAEAFPSKIINGTRFSSTIENVGIPPSDSKNSLNGDFVVVDVLSALAGEGRANGDRASADRAMGDCSSKSLLETSSEWPCSSDDENNMRDTLDPFVWCCRRNVVVVLLFGGGKFWNACIVDKDKFVKQSNANLIPCMVRWWKSQK